MPYCPHCGALIAEDAATCKNCGSSLVPQQPSPSASSEPTQTASIPTSPQSPLAGNIRRNIVRFGVGSAILSLFVLPEIFGPVAIVIGAYLWRNGQKNSGIGILVAGIICLFVGFFFTAFFSFFDLIPS